MLELSAEGGERLDVLLAGPLGSRSAAGRAIADGRVTVDGVARAKSHVLAAGARVRVRVRDEVEADVERVPAVPAAYAIAYRDEHLLVVDKPAGVVVHPGRGNPSGTLAEVLAAREGAAGGDDPDRPGIVHRLDRDTSGLMVVARSAAVHAALKELIRTRGVTREYVALVEGHPPARTGTIEAPIGRDRRVRTRVSTDTDEPRDAVTHFAVERPLATATLLRVTLETGRTHQIRAHLLAIGHPVAGDPDYGRAGLFGLRRQFLHAGRLTFAHPVTSAPVEVRSPLPHDLVAALRVAEEGERSRGGQS